jgi:hypothetical protein
MARALPVLFVLSLAAMPCAGRAEQANLCQELAAFVEKAAPAAPQRSSGAQASASAQSAQPIAGGPTAVEAPGAASQPKPAGSDPAQQTSSLSGPVREEGVGAAGPQGRAQMTAPSGGGNPPPSPPEAQARGAPAKPAAAPAPQTATTSSTAKAPELSADLAQQARAAIEAKDAGACRAAAQRMRRAGIAMPAPLLALAATPQPGASGQPR